MSTRFVMQRCPTESEDEECISRSSLTKLRPFRCLPHWRGRLETYEWFRRKQNPASASSIAAWRSGCLGLRDLPWPERVSAFARTWLGQTPSRRFVISIKLIPIRYRLCEKSGLSCVVVLIAGIVCAQAWTATRDVASLFTNVTALERIGTCGKGL